MSSIITTLDLIGVAVFAISGALAAAEKRLDILGFILFGSITGIGGGTLRDLLLNTDQVFWISDTRYLWVCLATAIATWFLAPQFQSVRTLLLWADALGLALFSVLGTAKALAWEAPFIVAAGMGMMTATFGSLIRDSLLGRPPVLLEPDIYVTRHCSVPPYFWRPWRWGLPNLWRCRSRWPVPLRYVRWRSCVTCDCPTMERGDGADRQWPGAAS